MEKILLIGLFAFAISIAIFVPGVGATAVLFGAFCTLIAAFLINKNFDGKEKDFLQTLFLVGLLLRLVLAVATYAFSLQSFFGGDSITYDRAGYELYNSWFGYSTEVDQYYLEYGTRTSGSGFGMTYVVAAIYSVVGRNPLATQFFNSVLGSATAVLIYVCAKNIFKNSRVARLSAVLVAGFPSLIIWSSQGLKDGIICFLLALAINNLLSLQKQLNPQNIISLLTALVGIYTLRFYIFFAFAVAILGSFFIGAQKTAGSVVRQLFTLIVITLALMYLGVLRNAQENLEKFGNLETLQNSRRDQATSAESGFGQDIDVSTSEGAISVLPIGLLYLLLAPFPWQMSSLRQAITLPEVLIWWSMIPFLITGVLYIVRNKLRESIGIILLTLLLTISYAIFQGNVGTAYRMRAQMQIFYFIFIAVGITAWQEKRENQNLSKKIKRRETIVGTLAN